MSVNRRSYTLAVLDQSAIGESLAVANHVRLLGYRVITTGGWQVFDLPGSLDGNRAKLWVCFPMIPSVRRLPHDATDPFRSFRDGANAVDLAVQRGARQVLCRAWLGPRDQVNSRPSSWPQRRPDFLSVLGRVSRDCCSATKRPRSSATRRQVVRQSALVIAWSGPNRPSTS